ncbi:MAG TPA: sugar phosphate isomerase/epimerase family protein [Bryobacteraceae bacterium]|nr:sugar phosphate isomerase/epimerase family protein [Bryobacteraceae bacterium]
MAAAAPFASAAPQSESVPVGLELYSVREELARDVMGTVRQVAQMGYQVVEFYAPYFQWTPAYAKDVRKLLDDVGVRCHSTHNSAGYFSAQNLPHAIELNQTLGSKYVVMSSAGSVKGLDGWKGVAERLNQIADSLKPHNMLTGYHNHGPEFTPVDGRRPIEVLAANTDKSVMLQLDVGTCVAAGSDPVAWIKAHPGRIHCIHCKEWSRDKGYKVLFGEGASPWKQIFAAAESVGGIEYYLIEQETSPLPSAIDAARQDLANWRKLRG